MLEKKNKDEGAPNSSNSTGGKKGGGPPESVGKVRPAFTTPPTSTAKPFLRAQSCRPETKNRYKGR